ncbi:MAG TPA: Xaa-Pro peptidase family protein [Bacilli bacterium]
MVNDQSRMERLQHKMLQQQIDACLVSQNVDLFYFCGSMQTGYLFIPAQGEASFYVRRSLTRAKDESSVTTDSLGSFRSFGERLRHDYPSLFCGLQKPVICTEFDVLPVQIFRKLEEVIPHAQWVDGSLLIRETRMIKSQFEISKIKEAAEAVNIALEQALAQIKAGMTELELISLIEHALRIQGHLGIMRMRGYNQEIITGMVGSGRAAAMPTYFDGPAGGEGLSAASPQGAGRKQIERDEPILIDIGCCIDGYVIDQTRTVCIGKLPEDLTRAYDLSEEILRNTEHKLKPGTVCEDIYLEAYELAKIFGLSANFMGYGEDQVKFLGHGIGLEIDELPILAKGFKTPLEPGMVIAIEPKFSFPGRGVVGIENTYVITDSGFDKLTFSREGIIRV